MNEIIIVNRHHKPEPTDRMFYIGRGSPLGNPFVINERWDREFVIELYGKWLTWKMDCGDKGVLAALNAIGRKVLDGTNEPVLLECYCSPKPCHGDVIKKAITDAINQRKSG